MEIKNSIILITGGSSGLGKSTAKLLIGLGAHVAITGLNVSKLQKIASQIGAFPIHADVSKDADVERTFSEVLAKFGKLDVLINNAGTGIHKPIEEISRADFQHIFNINVFGVAMMTKAAAEIFKKQNSGTVINIGSTSGLKGYQTGSVYASSKFALRGLTQSQQAELRPHNIRVILLNPSEVPTAFGREDREERPNEPKKLTSLEIAHTIVSTLSMDNRGMIPEVTVWATNPW
jgi:3-oxoacyl-[acyl-carrier protein] reductase